VVVRAQADFLAGQLEGAAASRPAGQQEGGGLGEGRCVVGVALGGEGQRAWWLRQAHASLGCLLELMSSSS
jgi:hypothetical protein